MESPRRLRRPGYAAELMHSDSAVGEVFNAGIDKEIRILDLAETRRSMTNSDSDIVSIPYSVAYEENFSSHGRLDARSWLGWAAQ